MTFKVRLETYHDAWKGEPIKKKRGWVPCNDVFYLLCALWDYNHSEGLKNIVKISMPSATPGYNVPEFIQKMKEANPSFVEPELIWREEMSA
jgi:hypothetical protein